jgi:hypothetical protein
MEIMFCHGVLDNQVIEVDDEATEVVARETRNTIVEVAGWPVADGTAVIDHRYVLADGAMRLAGMASYLPTGECGHDPRIFEVFCDRPDILSRYAGSHGWQVYLGKRSVLVGPIPEIKLKLICQTEAPEAVWVAEQPVGV